MILYVFGAGGSAVETLEDSHTLCSFDNFVFIEDSPIGNKINMFGEVYDLISLEQFSDMMSCSDPAKVSAIITPKCVKYKQKIHKLFPDLDYVDCISKRAYVLSGNIGKGFDARAFVFVGSTAKVGNFVKVNYHGNILHNCIVGDYSFISHNVAMGGNVNIGSSTCVYENSTILPGITIGSNTVIGAGSLVTKDIPDNVVAYGNPCKVVKDND